MNRHSLTFRLLISAIFLLLVLLPAIGFTLNSAFEKHLVNAIKDELLAQGYGILSDIEYFDGELTMPEKLLNSPFNVIDSGLYAIVVNHNSTKKIWHSPSALTFAQSFDKFDISSPTLGQRQFYQTDQPAPYFISSLSVSFSDQQADFPVTLYIFKSQQSYLISLNAFRQQLLIWLLIIAGIISLILWRWLKWTLKPLNQLSTELHVIEQGDSEKIEGSYPIEVTPLVNQLNLLIQNEQSQRTRYRNAMADLAHSLKTPLATIRSSANVSDDVNNEVGRINNIIEHQLKRAQSVGQSAWRLSLDVKPVVDKLLNAMNKIYREKHIDVSCHIALNSKFKGDEADLLEVLGNLLDNAFKAAKSCIDIRITHQKGMLKISVADDGKGVLTSEREQILMRGMRADTYEQGHGIGLAIVRDIVQTYQGKLTIENDPHLCGALFIVYFPS